jgi:hypothetical protein
METKEYFNVTVTKEDIRELFEKHGFKYSIVMLEEEFQEVINDWVHDRLRE